MKYLHLGEDTVVYTNSIIGLFDMDTTTLSKHTRNFLNRAQREGKVVSEAGILPRSFAVCTKKNGESRVYLSPINTATLKKRI